MIPEEGRKRNEEGNLEGQTTAREPRRVQGGKQGMDTWREHGEETEGEQGGNKVLLVNNNKGGKAAVSELQGRQG